jgi:hypothetical protein
MVKTEGFDPDTRVFLRQNDRLAQTVTKKQLADVMFYTEHHSGGLFVACRRLDAGETFLAKMHDTWGDPDDPSQGPVVVHLYDANVSPDGDVVLYLTTGKAAADLFLNDEALVAIWKATR